MAISLDFYTVLGIGCKLLIKESPYPKLASVNTLAEAFEVGCIAVKRRISRERDPETYARAAIEGFLLSNFPQYGLSKDMFTGTLEVVLHPELSVDTHECTELHVICDFSGDAIRSLLQTIAQVNTQLSSISYTTVDIVGEADSRFSTVQLNLWDGNPDNIKKYADALSDTCTEMRRKYWVLSGLYADSIAPSVYAFDPSFFSNTQNDLIRGVISEASELNLFTLQDVVNNMHSIAAKLV